MKNMGKTVALMGVAAAAIGGGMYLLNQNPQMKKKVGKTMTKAMDNAENMIAKKMN